MRKLMLFVLALLAIQQKQAKAQMRSIRRPASMFCYT